MSIFLIVCFEQPIGASREQEDGSPAAFLARASSPVVICRPIDIHCPVWRMSGFVPEHDQKRNVQPYPK
jgi:hypothetical protein